MHRPLTRAIAGPRGLLAVLLAGFLVLAACGGDDGDEASTDGAAEDAGETEALPELDTVFDDDMADDRNGWGEGETEEFTTGFTADGYGVSVSGTSSFFSYPDAGPPNMEDSATTVTVDDGAGPADRWFGPMCRLSRTGINEYYAFVVNNATGAYAIHRWNGATPEAPVLLADGDDQTLQGVGTDDEVAITGYCLGEGDGGAVELILAVDGEEIARVTDEDGLPSGPSGLSVAPPEGRTEADAVTFTDVEIAGDEGSADLEFTDDFSDPSSGFLESDDVNGSVAYVDDRLEVQVIGILSTGIPVRGPLPAAGTASVTLTGDLTGVFSGICLAGAEGQYEFAISSDGYASLGFYPVGGEFVLLDETTDGYADDGDHRITAGWSTNGTTTNLDLYVDDEVVASVANDESVTGGFSGLAFCSTVSTDAPAGTTAGLVLDDLVVVAG